MGPNFNDSPSFPSFLERVIAGRDIFSFFCIFRLIYVGPYWTTCDWSSWPCKAIGQGVPFSHSSVGTEGLCKSVGYTKVLRQAAGLPHVSLSLCSGFSGYEARKPPNAAGRMPQYLLLLCFLQHFLLSSILSLVLCGLMILVGNPRHQPPLVFWVPGGLTESWLHYNSVLVLGVGRGVKTVAWEDQSQTKRLRRGRQRWREKMRTWANTETKRGISLRRTAGIFLVSVTVLLLD